jgi:predicted nuclease with TOPRIM domain
MTGIDRNVTGLKAEVFQALKSINTKDGIDETEAAKIKEAIDSDGQIDDNEADLLNELMASPFKLTVKAEQAGFEPKVLYFGQDKEKVNAGARAVFDSMIDSHLASSTTALATQVKAMVRKIGDGNITPEDAKQFSQLLKTISRMPPERQNQVIPLISESLSLVVQGKGQADEVLQAAKSFDASNPIKLGVDFDALARQRSAAQSTQVLDLAHSMTQKDYDTLVYKPSQYFDKTQAQFEKQLQEIDSRMTAIKGANPVDEVELAKLTKLRSLTQALINVHVEIGKANHSKTVDRYKDAGQVVEKIAEARRLLAGIRPKDIGQESYEQMESILTDYTAIAVSFPRQVGHPNAVNQLNSFYMQVYERVRELESGRRKGFPKTVSGALQTYPADVRDLQIFAQRFASLSADLKAGKFKSEAEYVAAMRGAVPGTSNSFIASVQSLAQAQWFSDQSRLQVQAGESKLSEAQSKANQATQELRAADGKWAEGTQQLDTLDSQELNQSNLGGARSTLVKVEKLRQEAYGHLAKYDQLRKEGGAALQQAEKHRQLALAYLKTSDSYLDLVRTGDYANQLKNETGKVASENAALRSRVSTLEAGIKAEGDRFRQLDQVRSMIEGNLDEMGTRIQFSDLDIKARELAKGGAKEVRERLNGHLLAHKDELSQEALDYLKDPAQFAKTHADDNALADVREELQELFQRHPDLADKVAQEMTSFQGDFQKVRGELEQELRQAQAAAKANPELQGKADQLQARLKRLDAIEHRLIDSWLGEHATMLEALNAARGESPAVKNAMAATVKWVETTQERYAGNLLGDDKHRKAASEGFEEALLRPDMQEYRDKIAETNAKYGTDDGTGVKKPQATVPMVMVLQGTGQMMSFNAYVYKKNDGYMVLNPIDKKYYYGKTQDAALKDMATQTRLGNATLQYRDSQGVQKTTIQAPEGASGWEKGLAIAGFIGGTALLLLPEPTSKVGAVAMYSASAAVFVSSVYFATKGTIQLVDLYQNDNLGWNKETGMAAFDLGTGILGALGSAGTAGKVALAGRSEAFLAQNLSKLAPLAKNNALAKANFATGIGIGLPVAGYQIAEIHANKQMTTSQKQWAIGQIALFTTTPLLIGGAIQLRASRENRAAYLAEVNEVHNSLKNHLDGITKAMGEAELPEVKAGAKPSLSQALKMARDFYEGIDSKAPPEAQAVKAAGLKQVAALEAELASYPDVKTRPDNSVPVSKLGDAAQELIGNVTEVIPIKGNKYDVSSRLEAADGEGPAITERIAKERGLIRDTKNPNIYSSADKKVQLIYDAKSNQIKLRNLGKGYTETISLEKPGSTPAPKAPAPVLDEVRSNVKDMAEAAQRFEDLFKSRQGFENAQISEHKSLNGEKTYTVKDAAGNELMSASLKPKLGGMEITIKGKIDIKLDANGKPQIIEMPQAKANGSYKLKLAIPEPTLPKNRPQVEYQAELAARAKQRAEDVKNPDSIHYDPDHGPMVTAVVDPKSGEVFYGTNLESVPIDLHPLLKQRLDLFNAYMDKYRSQFMAEGADGHNKALITHAGKAGTHSEFVALDQAIKAREKATGRPATVQDLKELAMSHQATEGHAAGSCFNCTHIASQGGTPSLSGDKADAIKLPPGVPSFQDYLKLNFPNQKAYDFNTEPVKVVVPPKPNGVYVPSSGLGTVPDVPDDKPKPPKTP